MGFHEGTDASQTFHKFIRIFLLPFYIFPLSLSYSLTLFSLFYFYPKLAWKRHDPNQRARPCQPLFEGETPREISKCRKAKGENISIVSRPFPLKLQRRRDIWVLVHIRRENELCSFSHSTYDRHDAPLWFSSIYFLHPYRKEIPPSRVRLWIES